MKKHLFGFWAFLFPFLMNGQQDTGKYGQRVRYFYESGKVSSEGYMKDGVPNGIWTSYHENGALKSLGLKRKGISDSVWNFYTLEGTLKTAITYSNGKKNGTRKEFSTNGNLIAEEAFLDDQKNGLSRQYFLNGKTNIEVPFLLGKEHGKAREYDSLGMVITMLEYEKGVMVKRKPVNRYDKLNKRAGQWVELYDDGSIKKEVYWQNGLKNGYLKEYDPKGNLTKLERYVDDVLQKEKEDQPPPPLKKRYHANGKVSTSGPFTSDGKKTGQHIEFDTLGIPKTTEFWQNGILLSKGMLDTAYRKQGVWEEYYPTGDIKSKGAYIDDLREGNWSYFFPGGATEQTGAYKAGRPDGVWNWFYENGKLLRKESYKNGRESGYSYEATENGDTLAYGEFVQGRREGPWIFKQGNHRIVGGFTDDLMDGTWKHFFPDGKPSFEGSFSQGVPFGKHKAYRNDGALYWEGSYLNGNREGYWKMYDTDGLIYLVIAYENGIEKSYDGVKIHPPFDAVDYELLLEHNVFKY